MTEEVVHRNGGMQEPLPIPYKRRVSWAAIFAGLVTVLVIQLFLSTVGISIGAGTIEPMTESAPFQGLGLGAGIWLALSTLVALFAGGWVAGRVAHVLDRTDAALHGFLTWGLATLAAMYFMTTIVGGLVSGAAGVLGKSISALGQGASSVGAVVMQEGAQYLDESGVTLTQIKQEATTLLRQTQNPQAADGELNTLLERLMTRADSASTAADKEAIVNVLVNRSGMPRAQAEATVNRWEQNLANAKLKLEETRMAAEVQARQTGEKAAAGVAKTAGWSAFVMLLGAIAASFGGLSSVTSKNDPPMEYERHRRTADVLS